MVLQTHNIDKEVKKAKVAFIGVLQKTLTHKVHRDCHWHPDTSSSYAMVKWWDPLTNMWNGPDPVLIWGRGSVCVFSHKEDGAQ